MKAMIFAAGLGTRLKPITDTMPKALVPVCGQPLLYHVISKLVAAGYDDLVVNVHHFPDQIIHYLHFSTPPAAPLEMTERDSFAPLGMTKGLSSRPSEGTLSFRPSEARGEICHNEPFLVHNVDIVSNLDLNWLREQHREGALATLVVSERKTQRYFLFDEDNRLKGWTNIATGEVRSPFGDIDPDRCRKLAFAGIHLISPAIFDAFDKYGFGDRFSIVDFYLRACADYPIYAAVPPDFTLVDVGKFDALPEAEATCATILND